MEKIASFRIDHLRLEPGIYVSRKDVFGGVTLTTFDIRLTAPNREPVLNTAELHTIEHLGATFLRNRDGVKERVVYFGPMGCRTGFYAILEGDLTSEELVPLMREMFAFIRDFEGEIPGAKPEECGNYADQSLPMAQWHAARFLENTLANIDEKHLTYPA